MPASVNPVPLKFLPGLGLSALRTPVVVGPEGIMLAAFPASQCAIGLDDGTTDIGAASATGAVEDVDAPNNLHRVDLGM
jgi:hypothetical protein